MYAAGLIGRAVSPVLWRSPCGPAHLSRASAAPGKPLAMRSMAHHSFAVMSGMRNK